LNKDRAGHTRANWRLARLDFPEW